jgi:nucleoside-diphosphate-sugar epimerase
MCRVEDYEKILVEREVMGHPRLPGTILRLPTVYGPGDSQHAQLRPTGSVWSATKRSLTCR